MTNGNALLACHSGRGGYRENAGRKSSWQHAETRTIRVPEVFASQLIQMARRLDNGEEIEPETKSKLPDIDTVTDSKSASFDNVTDSKWSLIDTGTKSKPVSIDNDTDSNPVDEADTKFKQEEKAHNTDAKFLSSDNVTDSILPLSAALVQTVAILKAKRSARVSLAKLLSAIYHTQVRPDDLA